jgi:hypothetical protein
MDIILLHNQNEHVERMSSILDNNHFAFDLSMMGSGKTYTSTRIAHLRKLSVIVICPASVIPKWKLMKSNNPDIKFHIITSFQSLRSTKLHQPSHGLLYRREVENSNLAEFQITPLLETYIKEGTLVIIDEIQNIKNVSIQLFAVQALTRMIVTAPQTSRSKLLLLSASPIDKAAQAVEIFRGIGILLRPLTQYNPAIGSNVWTGLRDIHEFCLGINARATKDVEPKHHWEITYDNFVYRLFQHVILKHCSSQMKEKKHKATLTKANAYYTIDEQGEEIMKRGMHVLTTATCFTEGNVVWDIQRISSISRALQVIETGKLNLFVRIARQYLESTQGKIVLAMNYSESLNDLRRDLAEFNPLSLEGCSSVSQRETTLQKFSMPTLEHRVLVCNQSVASTGIDLDDKHGGFPRLCLVSPNYSSITAFQLGHRFLRMDTKSNATVHFVYAKRRNKSIEECKDIIELRVLDALGRKSSIMRETIGMEIEVQFPGEHEDYIEKN